MIDLGPYVPLLRVDFAHGFFADGRCPGLRFVPVGDTAGWIRSTDAIERHSGSAFALYGPAQALAVEPKAVLAWQVHATDEAFPTCTDNPAQWPDELLWFDAGDALRDAGRADREASFRLHRGETVTHADVRPLTWPLVSQSLGTQSSNGNRLMPPLALLRVPLAALPPAPLAFTVRLAPRETVWKYCLHGDWPEPQLQVVDLANGVEFGEPEPDRLDNGAPLVAIRSRSPIALAQRSERRFQLRSRQRGGDKVLVKRLPVAAAQFLAREQIDGESRLVSEIHVHR
jgi:hypothetical protein